MEERVGRNDFPMFFAVHEVEAWLLGQPALFSKALQGLIAAKAKRPESVNFDTPPAKMLEKLYQKELKKPYSKVANARNLFLKLDPDTVYGCCPYFKRMMDRMLELAKAREG